MIFGFAHTQKQMLCHWHSSFHLWSHHRIDWKLAVCIFVCIVFGVNICECIYSHMLNRFGQKSTFKSQHFSKKVNHICWLVFKWIFSYIFIMSFVHHFSCHYNIHIWLLWWFVVVAIWWIFYECKRFYINYNFFCLIFSLYAQKIVVLCFFFIKYR